MLKVWTSSRTRARLFHHRLLLATLLELDRPIPLPTPLLLHPATHHIFRPKFHKSCGQRRLLLESGLLLKKSLCAALILRQSPLQLALILRITPIIFIRISFRSQSIRPSMFILTSIHVSLSMTARAEQPFSPIDESDDWSRAKSLFVTIQTDWLSLSASHKSDVICKSTVYGMPLSCWWLSHRTIDCLLLPIEHCKSTRQAGYSTDCPRLVAVESWMLHNEII